MKQNELFTTWPIESKPPQFDGATFSPELDGERLTGQQQRVTALMRDGKWRTLAELAQGADVPLSTIGSRVRDARKPKFGGHTIESRRGLMPGVWEYRMVNP